ncbi:MULTISPECIES: glycoside hydrolase family 13 protein [Vagococcus]|uniref:Neopullulanase n=1 Tax=Vagococcus fluvialis bH819 TaxID=1255619 RepID=A0A1X6WNL3_9ENTE|nr:MULTISPECIES: glycoside hydrolase family 13 protein [Vagococcus]SLM85822.1 Neopullulanase [Vagococcus fluvialis bH819]HCM90244.1 glycoside hydrolase family 13 protein [Vagococcus sp.]
MDIQYNSWLTKFKQPFGAIKSNDKVEFNIFVDSKEIIHSVSLVIKKQQETIEIEELPMTLFEENKYKCHYQVKKGSGLYLYCFKIHAINKEGHHFHLYYGKNKTGGQGHQYTSEAEISWYQLTSYSQIDEAPSWYRNACFYQIFPDRFFNGNPEKQVNSPKKNTMIYGSEEDLPFYIKDETGDIKRWDFYGGNLKGIKEKIPYLKELGITALYLNPIFEANSNHRYDTNDYFNIDPVLGTNEEFRDLVNTLHENNMNIILDGVFSHVGRNSRYFNYSGEYGKYIGAYQNPESKYFSWFNFFNFPDEYKSWWGIADLPEVNKHIPSFQQFIYGDQESVLAKWEDYNIDGWRLDVADELPNFFLKGIREKLNQKENQVLIGEVWEDASNKIAYGESKEYASYPVLHGVMNYPLREQILDLINEQKPVCDVISEMVTLKENYPKYFYYNALNNIGTHDTDRIYTECGGSYQKVALAFALLFMVPGVPCIYYGDEVGLEGEKDPDNRRFYPWNSQNITLKKVVQNWTKLRESHLSLSEGNIYYLYNTKNNLMAIHRYVDSEESLCLFNFSDYEKDYYETSWQCDELNAIAVSEILKRFDIPKLNVSKQHYLFLVKSKHNKI